MSNITQKTQDAYLAGANFSMAESFNLFGAVCIATVIFLTAYIIFCILKGVGDDAIKISDMPSLIIRPILLILVLSCFLFYQ